MADSQSVSPQTVAQRISFDGTIEALSSSIRESLQDLVEGAQADIINFTDKIAIDSVNALTITDPERRERVLKELGDQVMMVGELNRIRAVNAGWDTVARVIRVAQRTALALLGAAIVA